MSKAEKVSEPTMEEILASIRKIIAEEPAGAKSNGVGVPPIEAPRVRPLAPAGVGTAAERIASFSVGAGSATPQQPSAVVGSHLAAPQVPAPRTDVAQVARRASKEDQNALSHLLLDEDLADLVEPLPVATRPATAAKAIQPAGEATTMSPIASDRADPEASARPGPRPGPVPVAAPAVAASPVGGAGNSDIAGWRFQRPGSHEPVYPPAEPKAAAQGSAGAYNGRTAAATTVAGTLSAQADPAPADAHAPASAAHPAAASRPAGDLPASSGTSETRAASPSPIVNGAAMSPPPAADAGLAAKAPVTRPGARETAGRPAFSALDALAAGLAAPAPPRPSASPAATVAVAPPVDGETSRPVGKVADTRGTASTAAAAPVAAAPAQVLVASGQAVPTLATASIAAPTEPAVVVESSAPALSGAEGLVAAAGVSAVRSLEDTVAELLRPLLREWLDKNMPRIVEKALRIEMAGMPKPGGKSPGA